jgi:hypothetical protein
MKEKNISVAFFVLGSVIKFREPKRSTGSSEYYKTVWTLCRQKNITKVLIVQKSDWNILTEDEQLMIDPRGILVDVYSTYRLRTPPVTDKVTKSFRDTPTIKFHYIWDALQDEEKPDFGIGYISQGMASCNLPNFINQLSNPDLKCTPMQMCARYSGPIIHYLNMSNITWYMIATDPRYIKDNMKHRELVNVPKEILAQYTRKVLWHSLIEYLPFSPENEKPIDVNYKGVEKINLIGEKIIPPDNQERTNKFSVVAMQSSWGKTQPDWRHDVLKKWVFKYDKNQEMCVYGKWAEGFTKGYPQFKGYLPSEEIDKIFENTRYTLVIPIRKNWVTSKYAEMLRVGVVPFIHPDYDTQYNVIPKDNFIRLKSVEDFHKKMKYLDENPDKRIALVKTLQQKLLSNTKKGEFLVDVINQANKEHNIDVNIKWDYNDTVKPKQTKSLF